MKHELVLAADVEFVVLPEESSPRVSSQTIAKAFGKTHASVLKRIQVLSNECPKNFTQVNFDLSSFLDSTGRELPHYLLTRDAFSLLAMGFTGPKALKFKLRYIEAFNKMERHLLGQRLLAAPEGRALISQGMKLARRLTPERRREIRRAVRYKSLGLSNSEVGRILACGKEKVRGLLQDHELSQGGGK
jgi:Rha family phage regulatory protein